MIKLTKAMTRNQSSALDVLFVFHLLVMNRNITQVVANIGNTIATLSKEVFTKEAVGLGAARTSNDIL